MKNFKNSIESYEHSLTIFDKLYEYDDFMDSLQVVADMGCGSGLDINWWATLMSRDDPPEPHNYTCYAVDKNIKQLEVSVLENSNVVPVEGNFETRLIPRQIDFIWCHNSFQFVTNPLNTLKLWNENMNVNGMMVLTIPQHQGHQYNRLVTRSFSNCFYHYNICNLMYMLAVSGFDCKDCFFRKSVNDSWLYAAVYKSEIAPLPASTTWHDLVGLNLVNDSVAQSLNKYGHVRQEDILVNWLDKDFYRIRD